jgi:hypothetical protein
MGQAFLAAIAMLALSVAQAPVPPERMRPPAKPGSASGAVLDADRRPVEHADVRIFRRVTMQGRSQLIPAAPPVIRTDASGVYRFLKLQPGEYVIAAVAYAPDQTRADRAPARRVPAPTVQSNGVHLGYITTFYPSVTSADAAQTVVIEEEQERVNLDIVLARRQVADVRGRVASPVRLPSLALTPADPADHAIGLNSRQVPLSDEGQFEIPDVPFGRYVLASTDPRAAFRVEVTVSGAMAPVAITASPRPVKGADRPVRP